ncbi:MAG: transglutaminase family protein [Oscillospiraceae bacterium]|nr:transglutaminase family protein [Oscillospiraceae bacterium]
MRKLQFEYCMELTYSQTVSESHYTLKCLPRDTDMQQITDLTLTITPAHDCQRGTDSFGNLTVYGNLYFPHDRFTVTVTGTAETWLAVSQRCTESPMLYRHPHGLNRPDEGIRSYFDGLISDMPQNSHYEAALYLMHSLHRDFSYEQGFTGVSTSAGEAWSLGKGVCQDYAHIFIALCHLAGIPARYVTGMMIGEGATHAWVEILSGDYWYAMDPTNDCIAADSYIKIAHGRDAADCMVNKGIIRSYAEQHQTVTVRVT